MNENVSPPPVAFIDLAAQRRRLGSKIDAAILKVVDHGGYIMGPEVRQIEADLSAFCGAKHTVSCANGTDALALILMAKGVKPGDAILCPSFTFAATAEVVAWLGAIPVFVDIHADTFNMDVNSLKAGIKTAQEAGLRLAGIIPVDLFGQPADYDAILDIAGEHKMWVLCDAAQSFGSTYKTRKIGTIGMATSTSFFPAKPLGCYGDGGAIFTEDGDLADIMRSLRVHGQNKDDKYDNMRIGMNGRLDTMQAAILIEKLKIFADEIVSRGQVAGRYNDALASDAITPFVMDGCQSVWAQYTLRLKGQDRNEVAAKLKTAGIPTAVYYPRPLHQQTAYSKYPVAGNGLPVSEKIAKEVLSLPMHPYLDETTQDRIITEVKKALA